MTDPAIAAGEALRDDGMSAAAQGHEREIKTAQKALLIAIRRSPNRCATTDDALSVTEKYPDGGRWRGSIPRKLAVDRVIENVGVVRSVRVSRHRGYLTLWRGRSDAAVDERIAELQRWLLIRRARTTKSNEEKD